MPDTDHVVFFHLLTEGSCLARLAGDLLLLAHDDRHVLGSDLNLPFAEVRSAPPQSGLLEFRAGGGGEATKFICGYLACDRRASRALLGSLPPMLRVSLGDVSRGGWLADLLRLGVEESRAQRPGSQSLLAKLYAGLQDPYVGRALALLHGEPTRGWTVEDLSREVALSRSALAERFAEDFGEVLAHFPSSKLMHAMGITEVSHLACMIFARDAIVCEGRLPVGRPADGVDLRVTDGKGRECPAGTIGTLATALSRCRPLARS